MGFIEEREENKKGRPLILPFKVWLICEGCSDFETKKYPDTDRGRAKMNIEADRHYGNCPATKGR